MAVAECIIGECTRKMPYNVKMVVTFATRGHNTHNIVLVVLSTDGMKKATSYTKHHHHCIRIGQVCRDKAVVVQKWRGIYFLLQLVDTPLPKCEALLL